MKPATVFSILLLAVGYGDAAMTIEGDKFVSEDGWLLERLSRVTRGSNTEDADSTPQMPHCCGLLPTLPDKQLEVTEKCKEKFLGQFDSGDFINMWKCISECIGQGLDLMNDNGTVKEQEMTEVMTDQYVEEELKEVARSVTAECVKQTNKRKKTDDEKCSTAAFRAFLCVKVKVHEKCPADLEVKSELCNTMQMMGKSLLLAQDMLDDPKMSIPKGF